MDAKGHTKLYKTKIVCTIGPSSSSEKKLEDMYRSGMDIARLNFSHGTHEEINKIFKSLRCIGDRNDQQLAIMCDIQGPKIRTGKMDHPFMVSVGDKIDVTPNSITGTKAAIQIQYSSLLKDVSPGDTIFINDGIIKLIVEKKNDASLTCVVETGGIISNHKGCNIPQGRLSSCHVTAKDRQDLELVAKLNPEFVVASFVGSAEDIRMVRRVLSEYGNDKIKIIAKVERPSAVANLEEIIEVSDGIMVARGDLGVEIDSWAVPIAQKQICKKCNAAGIPVIVATQMLESMTASSRPTRAEASDVFNSVLDGADAVMLSSESAIGGYPVEAVKIMENIIGAAEKFLPKRKPQKYNSNHVGMTETLALGSYEMAKNFSRIGFTGKCIVVTGPPSGYVARMVSKYRPVLDILAITDDLRTARELNLIWGVRSIYNDKLLGITDHESRNIEAIKKALSKELIKKEDHVIIVSRSVLGKHVGTTSAIYSVKEVFMKEARL